MHLCMHSLKMCVVLFAIFWDSYASALCTTLYLDGNYGNEIILHDTGPDLNYKLPRNARQHIHNYAKRQWNRQLITQQTKGTK